MRLYRGAQRLLALEEQVVAEVGRGSERRARAGRSRSAPRPAPAGSCSRICSASSRPTIPELHVVLWVFDTQTIVERVAARELELGVVGAARRHRGVVFEPFLRDEVILACPPGHRFAGKTVTLEELRGAGLIVMQEGAGVRQLIEDELQRAGMRLRDLGVAARARPAGVGDERRARPATASPSSRAPRSRPTSPRGRSPRPASRGSSSSARSSSCARAAAPRRAPPARSSSSRAGALP